MTETQGSGRFDLEERTFAFAVQVRSFIRSLPRTLCNIEDVKQLVRASGSVGANYIEANDALSKKDFLMRTRIARREAKEGRFFLRLVYTADDDSLNKTRESLVQESMELIRILSAIIRKSE